MLRKLLYSFPIAWEIIDRFRGAATRYWTHPRRPPVIVASLGRAGSTMVCNSIIQADCAASHKSYQRWMSFEPAWRIEKTSFQVGGTYKTHAKCSKLPDTVKIVFVYDDPMQIIGSLLKKLNSNEENWLKVHGKHLTNKAIPVAMMDRQDVFELKENFISWTDPSRKNIFFSHYDDLWSNEEALGDFVGVKLKLPERKPRQEYFPDLSDKTAASVLKTYGSLRKLIEEFRGLA